MDVKNYEIRNWRLIFINMEQLEKIKKFLQTEFAKDSLELLSVIAQMYGEDEISQTLYYYEGNEFPELYYDPNIGGRNGFKELKSGLLRQFLESLYELIQEDILDLFEDELYKYDSFNSSSFYVDLNFETKKLDLKLKKNKSGNFTVIFELKPLFLDRIFQFYLKNFLNKSFLILLVLL